MVIILVLLEDYKKNKPNSLYKQLPKGFNKVERKQVMNGVKKLKKHMNHMWAETRLNEKVLKTTDLRNFLEC